MILSILQDVAYADIKFFNMDNTNIYLLVTECEVRTVSYGPEFFSILMAQAQSARAMKKKQGSVTYGTDRANEVNKMFIIWLFFLLF